MRYLIVAFLLLHCSFIFSQKDTVKQIESVTINTPKTNRFKTDLIKPAGTLEQALSQDGRIDFIQRGGYGSEILLNGMSSERSLVTIDGMRIHSACSDKMDPTTSYLDLNNIDQINISSGGIFSPYGNTISGNVDLQSQLIRFGNKTIRSRVYSGIETNNWHSSTGASVQFISPKIYFMPTLSFRKAGDYKDGDNRRVNYSSFTKFNGSGKLGIRLNNNIHSETFLIYDQANNVGYPALPMDVRLAQMLLISQGINWSKSHCEDQFITIKAKVYYNQSIHIMDDSKRLNVPIRMDMPGNSKTAGYLVDINKETTGKKSLNININGHWNQSIAEMTMYPEGEFPSMYMYTWPNIHAINNRIHVNYAYQINDQHRLFFSGSLQSQLYTFGDSLGYNTTTIFHPEAKWTKNRFNPSAALKWSYTKKQFTLTTDLSYSDRSPSISEGYGFYLFNSYDRFDYIGDPNLKNEKSLYANIQILKSWKDYRHSIIFSPHYYHLIDYIYGRILPNISQMTIGASGVKQYEQMDHANQLNVIGQYTYNPISWYNLQLRGQYSFGKGENGIQLPFIAPFQLQLKQAFKLNPKHIFDLIFHYHSKQKQFGSYFGETETPQWFTINMGWKGRFNLTKSALMEIVLRAENITNQYYSTYSDWNKIPHMGRNFVAQLIFTF